MLSLAQYTEINNSFKKTAICRLGIDAGFFSEYRSMVDVLLYCLEHQIRFKSYSKTANYGYKNGWTDYFEPFCEEVDDTFHTFCNYHTRLPWKQILHGDDKLSFGLVKWKLKLDLLQLVGLIYKWKKGDFDYYTQDIAKKNHVYNRVYKIPELQFEGNYAEAFQLVNSFLWRIRTDIRQEIDVLIKKLQLPDSYMACHIRGGDKIIEFPLYTVDAYVKRLKELSPLKDVFVLTDDYRILLQLRKKAPDYRWYSLCQPEEQGYFNRDFVQTDPLQKKRRMVRFFSSIECLRQSSLFLGTVTSGPSLFIANLMYPNVCFVDIDSSSYLSTLDMDRRGIQKLILEYMQERSRNI